MRTAAFCLYARKYRPIPLKASAAAPQGRFDRGAQRTCPGAGGEPPTSKFFSFERQRKIEKWPLVYHGALLATIIPNSV